jgi:hypothetical protein
VTEEEDDYLSKVIFSDETRFHTLNICTQAFQTVECLRHERERTKVNGWANTHKHNGIYIKIIQPKQRKISHCYLPAEISFIVVYCCIQQIFKSELRTVFL